MNDYLIFKNLEGKYLTLSDCLEENKEKHENTVFYITDEKEQSQYINMFKQEGMDAVYMTQNIDSPFINFLEQKNENVKFLAINSDLSDSFKEEMTEEAREAMKGDVDALTEVFKKALGNDKLEVRVEKLKNEAVSSMITVSEDSRRMQEMMKMYTMPGMDPSMFGAGGETLVLNYNNKLVQYVLNHREGEHIQEICEQLYDLAALSHGSLTPERMTKFIARSNDIMIFMADMGKEEE